ncbi:MAG: hypothetical protein B6I31_01680 [Desulfobacteraceae bacterium 4572_19]|nr:MAG: hypothetical protein B6I31_01680 [Desulfobacteraceae bacterium 4572_19]
MPPQVKMPEVNVKEAEKLKDSCNGFEAIFVNQMLKSMRSTLSGEGLLDGGTGMDIYKSMYDQHLADNIANSDNGIGIGDMLYRQLSKSLPKEKM